MACSSLNTSPQSNSDIFKFAKQHKPPPPPGEPNLWELQFCRWWGWNWVQKTEMQTKMKGDAICSSVQQMNNKPISLPVEPLKVHRSHFKELYQCLCFKKRPKNFPNPKKIYITPSNSLTCICQTVTHDIEPTVCQKNITQPCLINCGQESLIQLQRESSDSDSCKCGCGNTRASSTDESVHYLKVMCNCCKQERTKCTQEQKKTDCQTQTRKSAQNVAQAQTSNYPIRICGTQTIPKREHKKKKKHITVLCCHCCQCECNCQENKHRNCSTSRRKIVSSSDSVCEPVKLTKCDRQTMPVFPYEEKRSFPDFKWNQKNMAPLTEGKNYDMSLDRYRPWDTIFTNKKTFPKFGSPYKIDPWINGTKSDILDQTQRQRKHQEFASPHSGKVFNLSPVKITELKSGHSLNLPDPLEINEVVENLRKLEEQLKMDLDHRALLDTVCDAILFDQNIDKSLNFIQNYGKWSSSNTRMQTCSSSLLHMLSYPNESQFYGNVGLRKDKCTQSLTNNIDFTTNKSKFSKGICSQKPECFVESLLPIQTEINKSDSSLSHEDPVQFNMNLYSFSGKSSSPMKPFKRTSPYSSDRPVKRIKRSKVKENSKAILKNMDDLFQKMNEIIYMEKPNSKEKTNKQVFQTKQVEIQNNIVKISKVSKELNNGNSQTDQEIRNWHLSEKNGNDNKNVEYYGNVNSALVGATSQNLNKLEKSLSSDSSLISKIDEIINKSQTTENQIEKIVLQLPLKKHESKRDYTNSELEKYMSPRSSDISNGLTTILESSDEISEDNFSMK